jgi:hypothetical protein
MPEQITPQTALAPAGGRRRGLLRQNTIELLALLLLLRWQMGSSGRAQTHRSLAAR